MKKLHEVARLRRQAELQLLSEPSESVRTEQQPTTVRSVPATEEPLNHSNNTLEKLLEQSVSSIGELDRAPFSQISSIGASKRIIKQEVDVVPSLLQHPPTPIPPRKNYRESCREEIAKLKDRRKVIQGQPLPLNLSCEEKLDLERIWEEVDKENDSIKQVAEDLLYNSACRTVLKMLRMVKLRLGLAAISYQARIQAKITTHQHRLMRRVFDEWCFFTQQHKRQSQMLLVMKQRIRADDELRRQINKHFPN